MLLLRLPIVVAVVVAGRHDDDMWLSGILHAFGDAVSKNMTVLVTRGAVAFETLQSETDEGAYRTPRTCTWLSFWAPVGGGDSSCRYTALLPQLCVPPVPNFCLPGCSCD